MAAATLESLSKQVDDLTKALDKPDLSHVKTDSETGAAVSAGGWGGDDSEFFLQEERSMTAPRIKRHGRAVMRRLKALNYKPNSKFKSFGHFIQEGMANPREVESNVGDHLAKSLGLKAGEITKAIAGMSEQVGTDGGALVLPEYSTQIFDRVYQNDIWGRTDNYTVGGNSMTFHANAETSRANGSRHGGLRAYWTGEGAGVTATKPTFRELTLKLRKLMIVVYLTDELMADAPALERYVVDKVDQELQFMLGDAVFNGTGAGQPLGLGLSPALISIAKETGQPAASLLFENVNKMYARLHAASRESAVWYMNQDVEPQLDLLSLAVGTGGAPVYLPQGGVSVAPFRTLKGRPIQTTEFNATLGTQLDVVLADLGQYVTISKGGIAQAVSMHVEFLTDQTALRFTLRVDGQSWENSPITPYKGSNTQSSVLTLDTRA